MYLYENNSTISICIYTKTKLKLISVYIYMNTNLKYQYIYIYIYPYENKSKISKCISMKKYIYFGKIMNLNMLWGVGNKKCQYVFI